MIKKILFFVVIFFMIQSVSAGVGIKWDAGFKTLREGTKTCFDYGVYNPWDKGAYVSLVLSKDFDKFDSNKIEPVFIPANTGSSESIPVEICLSVPNEMYEQECWIGDWFACKSKCNGSSKKYVGEVLASESTSLEETKSVVVSGVSAPLRIKVECVPYSRSVSLTSLSLSFISAIIVAGTIIRRRKKLK